MTDDRDRHPTREPTSEGHASSPLGPQPARPSGDRGARPALWLAGLVLLVLAFVGGLLVGERGLLQSGQAPPEPIPTSAGTPTAQQPASATPSPTSGAQPTAAPPATPSPTSPPVSPAASPTPAEQATPSPVTPRPVASPEQPAEAPDNFGLFWEALEIIRQNFVGRDELTDQELTYGAIRGLVDALGDTGHSVFLTPEALQRERESLSGTITGVGALLGERGGRPVIVSVISGGPAQRAGLRSGDVLRSVDGVDVIDMAPEEIVTLVRGEEGTTVNITVQRPATGEELEFSIVREQIRIPTATWAMVPGTNIAVLRLIQFSEGAAEELRAARDEALAAGAESLILDLRSNPGGFVHEAVRIASLFLEDETVYIRELANGERIPVHTCSPADHPERPESCAPFDGEATADVPLVVLIDEGTASSAEIVAGALRSAGRAELIGQTTFGTGTVLLTYELSDGSAVRIAVERWLTPEGELIFGHGIEPTIVLETGPDDVAVEPDELAELSPTELSQIDDPQLLRAIELLTGELPTP